MHDRKRLIVSRHKIILQERQHVYETSHEADDRTESEGRDRVIEDSRPDVEDCDDCSPSAMAYPETEEITKMLHLFEGEG